MNENNFFYAEPSPKFTQGKFDYSKENSPAPQSCSRENSRSPWNYKTLDSKEYVGVIDKQHQSKFDSYLELLRDWLQPSETPLEGGWKIIPKVNDFCTDFFNKHGINAYTVEKRLG